MRTDGSSTFAPKTLSWRDVTERPRTKTTKKAPPPLKRFSMRGDYKREVHQHRILTFLRDGKKYTTRYIADKVNVSCKATGDILYKLYCEGDVQRDTFGLTYVWYVEEA
jgi:hypothetical protein